MTRRGREDAVPVRVRRQTYEKARSLVEEVSRHGWRNFKADRDDPPTIASVIAAAIDQFSRHVRAAPERDGTEVHLRKRQRRALKF